MLDRPVRERNYFTAMCRGSEAGSYLRLIDFVYHSTLGLRVIKRRREEAAPAILCPCSSDLPEARGDLRRLATTLATKPAPRSLSEHQMGTFQQVRKKRFRGGIVLKAHKLCVSLDSRLESNKEEAGNLPTGAEEKVASHGTVNLSIVMST